MTTFQKWAVVLCGAFLGLSPVYTSAADEAKPTAEKEEKRKSNAPWLKGIELTEEQGQEIKKLHEIYDPQIKERQALVDAVVSPEKMKEVTAKVAEARKNGEKGKQLKDLRASLLGLTPERAAEFKGLTDNLTIARDELQAKTRLVLTEEQRKIFDENVAKKGGKKKAAA